MSYAGVDYDVDYDDSWYRFKAERSRDEMAHLLESERAENARLRAERDRLAAQLAALKDAEPAK